MNPEVLTSIVLAAQGVLIAFIGYLSRRLTTVKRDVAAVKHEVKNDHNTNLRVEQDERHRDNARKLSWLMTAVEGLTESVDFLANGYHSNRSRIWDLENTLPPRVAGKERKQYREETTKGETDAQQLPPIEARDLPRRPPVWGE